MNFYRKLLRSCVRRGLYRPRRVAFLENWFTMRGFHAIWKYFFGRT